jgi:hypothetical protein
MVREIHFRFTGLQSNGDKFKINIISNSQFFNASPEWTFKTSISASNDILIGATSAETIFNFQIALSAWVVNNAQSFIKTIAQPNGVDFVITTEDVDSSTISNTSDLFIEHTTTVSPTVSDVNYILSRSTYFIDVQPTTNFDKANLLLKVWHGDKVIDKPILPNYNLSKLVVIAGQTNITFDIHKIVNDYVKNRLSEFGQTQSAFTTSILDTVWIEAQITALYQDIPLGTITKTYLVLDGYGYHQEGYNPIVSGSVLNSIDKHIVYEGQDYPIYFKTFGLTQIIVNGVTVPFTFSDTLNSQKIAYVNIEAFLNTNQKFTAIFTYGTSVYTHNIEVKSSCRYPFVNCVFKNKFGVWQSMPFNLVSRKNIDVEGSEFQPFVSNFGRYNVTDHNFRTYNLNGREKISCNTDFIPENYVNVMQELMLSEQVYLQIDGDTIPVNKSTKSLSKKTKAIDKLIQYTIDFDYSFKMINQIV